MVDTVFVSAFVITGCPKITIKGAWVEFISESGDGTVKRFMTRPAAIQMIDRLSRALAETDADFTNVVLFRGDHV